MAGLNHEAFQKCFLQQASLPRQDSRWPVGWFGVWVFGFVVASGG